MSNFGEHPVIRLHLLSHQATRGLIKVNGGARTFEVAIGRNGRGAIKREGDGKSPIGLWHPRQVFYRADKIQRPQTRLPLTPLSPEDGWCDAPDDRNYNRPITHPYPASAERLWREDEMYDIIVELDHNQCPRVRNGGSAIFMHIAKPAMSPTEGCLAFKEPHLRALLSCLTRQSRILI